MSQPTENDLLTLLDIIIMSQLLIDRLDDFKLSYYNKQRLKQRAKLLLEDLEKEVAKDYDLVYKAGSDDTMNVVQEYAKMIALIRDFNVPQKVAISQFIQAWNYDKKTLEATVHRLLTKESKGIKA